MQKYRFPSDFLFKVMSFLIVRYNVFGCYSNHTDMDAIVNVFPKDVRPYSGSDASGGTMYNIDRSDTFGRRRMDIDGEK